MKANYIYLNVEEPLGILSKFIERKAHLVYWLRVFFCASYISHDLGLYLKFIGACYPKRPEGLASSTAIPTSSVIIKSI